MLRHMFFRLLLLFTVVPLVELGLLIQLGRVIGLAPTIAIVLLTGIAERVPRTLAGSGNVSARPSPKWPRAGNPRDALVDGLLILVAGAVLLTPGLLTDAFGFFLLILPLVRQSGGPSSRPFAVACSAPTAWSSMPSGRAVVIRERTPGDLTKRRSKRLRGKFFKAFSWPPPRG